MRISDFALNLGGGRRLILAGARLGGLWLAAGVLALVLLLALYRYERRLVSRGMGLTLLMLRIAAALALMIALFEPIAERTYQETVRGRVIVGVDLSESMATVDAGRPAEARERLRATLDLSPAESPETFSRREIARRLLRGGWLKRLQADHDVEVIGFAREAVRGGTPEALADLLKATAAASSPDPSAWLTTDWRPVLEQALEEKAGAPLLGVVLLTDGRQNAADDADPTADRLAARGVPVFPILIGSTQVPRDAAIAAVKAPDRVSKGDAADIEVTLKLDGLEPGEEVPVVLERPGSTSLHKMVKVPVDGSRPVATFQVSLDEVGPKALNVAVGPIENDIRADNDRRRIAIEVTDDRSRVLLIDGEARWEFRYLRNALVRDPHVTVESVVFHQPPPPESASPTYASTLPPPPSDGPDPLGAFDVILLGDVRPEDMPPSIWTRLESYVDRRGGTLVLSAGPVSWASLSAHETARKLLPVLDARPLSFDAETIDPALPSLPSGLAVRPTPEATSESWPMLRFAAEPERNRAIWEQLPKLPWVLGGRPKPLASSLVVAGDTTSAGASEQAQDAAVIVAMPYGLGKVLWVGTDATWRWRYRVGDAYHHRFWGQVVRWANAGKLTAGNQRVRFGPLKPRVDEGQGTTIRAQFSDDAPGVGPDLLVAARVFRAGPTPGEAVAVVPLRPSADRPRVFEGTAPALPRGSYVIKLDVPQLDDPPQDGAPLEVGPRETSERVELAASPDTLERLASPNGGKLLRDDEAAALPDLLKARNTPRVRVEPTTLWDQPASLLAVFAILAAEWALRKHAGLP